MADVELDQALSAQTSSEATHWRLAVEALADLDAVASPAAWGALETYLRRQVRDRLGAMVADLVLDARRVEQGEHSGRDEGDRRRDVLGLRTRYLQLETLLDFYGDAIGTRTNDSMTELLQGYDTLAADSMAASLSPLGIESPPALVYVDKGLGAAILRAGIRLWDSAHPSPAAAIKLTRHNLSFPTAMLHETGHQVGHLTGWNAELADALYRKLAPRSEEVADLWRTWASEVAADVHAFGQAGWASTVALANVVDGPSATAYRISLGDPHPYPLIRVLFNVALCRSWFGGGPWDRVAAAWLARHPIDRAPSGLGSITALSIDAMPAIVDVCTRVPMQAFRGAPFTSIADPRRVSPAGLRELDRTAGDSLATSAYLRRREPLRVFAVLATRALDDPQGAARHRAALRRWVADLGADVRGRPTITVAPTGLAS